MKFVVTDVMYPVLSMAELTEQGLKVEFGQRACVAGMNSRRDGASMKFPRRSGPTGYRCSGAPQRCPSEESSSRTKCVSERSALSVPHSVSAWHHEQR